MIGVLWIEWPLSWLSGSPATGWPEMRLAGGADLPGPGPAQRSSMTASTGVGQGWLSVASAGLRLASLGPHSTVIRFNAQMRRGCVVDGDPFPTTRHCAKLTLGGGCATGHSFVLSVTTRVFLTCCAESQLSVFLFFFIFVFSTQDHKALFGCPPEEHHCVKY